MDKVFEIVTGLIHYVLANNISVSVSVFVLKK